MTPGERDDPAIISGQRRLRIANGSGVTTSEVNQLLKQFKEVQKMMKSIGRMPAGIGGLKGMKGLPDLSSLPDLPPGSRDPFDLIKKK